MRTIAAVMVVLAVGTSGAMLGMSGFADVWGAEPPQTSAAQEELENQSGVLNPNEGPIEGPVSSSESSIVGLITSGIGSITDLAGAVILLPITLMNLGFPAWFAIPLGTLAEVIVGIGLIEWATQREWT